MSKKGKVEDSYWYDSPVKKNFRSSFRFPIRCINWIWFCNNSEESRIPDGKVRNKAGF